MNLDTSKASLSLEHRALLSVSDDLPVQVRCETGALWITEDGEPTDHVITGSECFTGRPGARLVILALADSQLRIARSVTGCESRAASDADQRPNAGTGTGDGTRDSGRNTGGNGGRNDAAWHRPPMRWPRAGWVWA